MEPNMLLFLLVIAFPIAKGSPPGAFFWKPRLGIDLTVPTTESSIRVSSPTEDNMRAGLVVLIDAYTLGLTIVGIGAGIQYSMNHVHLNPMSAYFYTNAYRWTLRHFSMLPTWLAGIGGGYCGTHKVWLERFNHMHDLVPKWMRYLFPYVKKEEWEKEEEELKRFKKYAEPAFGKHYRYPSKVFNNFKSQEVSKTIENLDSSSQSVIG